MSGRVPGALMPSGAYALPVDPGGRPAADTKSSTSSASVSPGIVPGIFSHAPGWLVVPTPGRFVNQDRTRFPGIERYPATLEGPG